MYAEWDDPRTIETIRGALAKRSSVVLLDAQHLTKQTLQKHHLDFVFNIAEGYCGALREAEIPALLDALGIPYTGSGPETLGICQDKARTKQILGINGVPTARYALFEPHRFKAWSLFPAIVKPNWEGSSKGILDSSIVCNGMELQREVNRIWSQYDQPALVEEFLEGREFTVGLLGNKQDIEVLPIVEICLECLPASAKRIYSYQAKWVWDRPENPLPILRCPADVAAAEAEHIARLAKQTYKILNCRDWCRIDFRMDGAGRIFVLEVNPLPGVLPDPQDNSCLPLAARTAGMTYEDLILRVLDIAQDRASRLGAFHAAADSASSRL